MKERRVYVGDFETRASDYDIAKEETSVWLWDICDIETLEHHTGKTMCEFFEHLKTLGESIIYFHNLDGFDGEFIIPYIISNQFNFRVAGRLKSHEWTCLIDDIGGIYNIVVCLDDGRKKHGKKCEIEFRDSHRKIPNKVEKIAKDYKLPILKGSIDYRMQRGEDYEATPEEIAYIHNDTEIVARVLKLQYDKGMDSMTSASDTFNLYKKRGGNLFKSLFPVLSDEEDDFIRASYSGGISYLNPKFKDKVLSKKVNVYDVNSMYPYQMCNELLPFSYPVYQKGKIEPTPNRPLFIQRIEVWCELKKGHMPSIILHNNRYGSETQFLINSFDPKKGLSLIDESTSMIELTLTNIDLELLFENYEIYEIKYIDGYSFLGSRNLFKEYILPLYNMKSQLPKGAERELIKLLINSLYGKFATKRRHIRQQPFLIDGRTRYVTMCSEETKPVYTAVASFITAYARKQLFSAINSHLDTFVYCDTDSVHLLDDTLPDDIVDGKRLGAWDLEKVYVKSKYLKQKGYCGIKEGSEEIEIKLAGCPEEAKRFLNIDNFKFGTCVAGKLLPMRVKGGVILVPTTFTIKA